MYTALNDFIVSKTASGLSERTVHWYAAFIRRYAEWLKPLGAPMEKPEMVEAYLAHLRADGQSAFTISGCYRALNVYFKWLVQRHKLRRSPMQMVPPPHTPIKRVKHIDPQQFACLYDSIPGDNWWEMRDQAILLVLLYSGLRASELLALHLDSIDRTRLLLLVNAGKGGKDRDVPCTLATIEQIDLYLSQRPPYNSQVLFLARDPASELARGPLRYDGLKEMLRRRCKAAGLPHFSAHKFRHAHAMLFVNAGMPLSALAASMGHSSVNVTERFYARWQTNSLSAAYSDALNRISSHPTNS